MPILQQPVRYGAYGSTNPNNYDVETIRMMKELGIWHPGMVTNKTMVGGHENPEYAAEQAAMQHIMALREHSKDTNENVNARSEARKDYAQQRLDAAKLMEQGRNDRASEVQTLRKQMEEDRVNQGLIQAAHETLDPNEHKALMAEYYKRLGVNMDTLMPKPKGEFGQPVAATAPTPYMMPERTPIRGATQAPAGYDYNLNTGEFIRKDQPGFINGQQVGGTAAPLRLLNPPPREEAGPTPVDFYSIQPTAPVAGGVGSPFDQFIRSLMPNSLDKRKIFGPRPNPNYVPSPEDYPDYALQ